MELDDRAKNASRELGDALNAAIESSVRVRNAIDRLREKGFEPKLTLTLALSHTKPHDEADGAFESELSEEDLQTLRRMKISFE